MSPDQRNCMEQVLAEVAKYFAVGVDELLSPSKTERLVWPRAVAVSLCCTLTNGEVSDGEVALLFGRDRSTISWLRRLVLRKMSTVPRCRADVVALRGAAKAAVNSQGTAAAKAEETVTRAAHAIEHTLERVRTDHQVRRYIGAFSETFHLLTAALAEIQGKNVDRVRDFYCPGSAGVHRNYRGTDGSDGTDGTNRTDRTEK